MEIPAPKLSMPQTRIECCGSDAFADWLAGLNGSLAVTTYQAGVALLGWRGAQMSLLMREFDKPMGLAVGPGKVALTTRHEVTLLHDAPLLGPDLLSDQPGRYDSLYLPRAKYHTGDINVHDMAFGTDGRWLVNSRFSCPAALSKDFSFVPRWQPPFIPELVPEDRCHMSLLVIVETKI